MMKRITLAAALVAVLVSAASAQHAPNGTCEACACKERKSLWPFAHVSWYLGLCEPVYVCDQRFRCKSPLRCPKCGPCAESSQPLSAPPMPPATTVNSAKARVTPTAKVTQPNIPPVGPTLPAPTVKQVRVEPTQERITPTVKVAEPKIAGADEQALLVTLRTGADQEVRRRAALELGQTGTRSFEVLKTLNLVISGSEQDGHRRETSPRVKAAALTALQQCLAGQRTVRTTPAPVQQTVAPSTREPALLPMPQAPVHAVAPTPYPDIVVPTPPPAAANPFRAID